MNSDEQFISTITKMNPKGNAVNKLRDVANIPFFVYTLPKTGTSTLSLSLQKMMNNKAGYEHVVHCHTEKCWKATFRLNFDFDLMTLIKHQNRKPIIFQLSRNPIERLISVYFDITRNTWKKPGTYKGLIDFMESQKNICNYRYYERKFNVQLKNLTFCHKTKHCLVEKDDFMLFYMKLEDFHGHLVKNVRTYLSHTPYNWQIFQQYISNTKPKSRWTTQVLNEIKVKGIPNNICQTIFDTNKDEVHFFFSPKERSAMEKKYNVTIN